jgi:acetylornithine deacetylase
MRNPLLPVTLGSVVVLASTQQQQAIFGGGSGAQLLSASSSSLDSIIADSPLLSLHRSLCEIKGISDHEQAIGDFLVDYLTAHNFTVQKQAVPFDSNHRDDESPRFNLYAYPSWQSASPGPEIILTSHIDTVPPYIPYSLSAPSSSSSSSSSGNVSREDILISGRGTVDAKASIAAQIMAAKSHLSSHPDTRLGLLFVVSEETTGSGMTFFSKSDLNTPRSRSSSSSKAHGDQGYHTVIFGEPTERALASGHKGSLSFVLSVQGKPAHSGYPWLGRSAISRVLPMLERLDNLGRIPVDQGGLPSSDKYGNTTVNIGVVKGGVASNVVPAFAEAAVTVRLSGGTAKEAKAAIEKAVLGHGEDDNEDIKLDIHSGEYAPVDLDTDVEGFDIKTMNYGTDVPHLDVTAGQGNHEETLVKRYLYGPGSIFVAHGENEAITVGELEAGYRGYSKLIEAAVERGKKLRR